MTPLTFRILRYLVHSCLALASACNFHGTSRAGAASLIKGQACTAFFVERMQGDFEMIKQIAGGLTAEDTFLHLHMVPCPRP